MNWLSTKLSIVNQFYVLKENSNYTWSIFNIYVPGRPLGQSAGHQKSQNTLHSEIIIIFDNKKIMQLFMIPCSGLRKPDTNLGIDLWDFIFNQFSIQLGLLNRLNIVFGGFSWLKLRFLGLIRIRLNNSQLKPSKVNLYFYWAVAHVTQVFII